MSLPSSYLDLTRKEQLFVDGILSGLSQVASATAAGYTRPSTDGSRVYGKEHVQKAILAMTKKTADEVGFGRKDAHDMYMDAYHNADTATEQIAAVNALVKLHGLEKPKQIEVQHKHDHQHDLRFLPTEDLMKLAGMEGDLVLEGEFEEVGDKPVLEPPKVTEDNTDNAENLPDTREGYAA